MKILVVDSDQEWLAVTSYALLRDGHRVIVERQPDQVLDHLAVHELDLILLDATIDGDDGLGLCRALRMRSSVPIIMVSPCREEEALVRSYEAGADDYVIAPFSPRQLLLRIAAVMRRCDDDRERKPSGRERTLILGDLEVDLRAFEVRKSDSRVPLTRTEFRLLTALLQSPGALVESAQLAAGVWEQPPDGHRRLVKTHVSRLRRKLVAAGGMPIRIRAVSRVGYILSSEIGTGIAEEPPAAVRPISLTMNTSHS